MLGTIIPVAAYTAACYLPLQYAQYIPAATWSIFILAIKNGIASWIGFAMALAPAALAVHLYTGKYSAGTAAAGLMGTAAGTGEVAPQMVVDYIYFPAIGAISTLAANTFLNLIGLSIGDTPFVVAFAILGVQIARILTFAAKRMIYPAPIVSQFMVTQKDLAKARQPIINRLKQVNVHKVLGDETSPVLGTVEYAVIGKMTGRSLNLNAEVSDKQWLIYLGGNGEVLEASFPSPLQIAAELRCNLLVLNPRGVGRSTGTTASAEDLILDAKTVIRRIVKDHGMNAEGRNVLIIGHSIGGGVAAALCTSELPKASVVFDRTFSSLADAAVSLSPLKQEALIRKAIPYVFGTFDVYAAYKAIPHERKLVLFHKQDQIIKFEEVSLGRFGPKELGGIKHSLELQGQTGDNHNTGFDKFSNYRDIVNRIKTIL